MSTTDLPLGSGTCEKCGQGVQLGEDGRVACQGCGETTDRCSCQP